MSYSDSYKIAGHVIKITSLHEEVHRLCGEYALNEAAEFSVRTSQADIAYERIRSASEDRKEGHLVRKYTDGYLETLAVYRKIAGKMTDFDTILFHGSAVAVDGIGYLFTAKSGTGKSTHTRLWRELFGERAVMVNDDKPLIRVTVDGVTVYGTPWDGKHRLSTNTGVPLKAVCLLERGAQNRIVPITKRDAYPMLMQQSFRPDDAAAMMKTMALVDRLGSAVSLFRLECNMEPEAARTAYLGMNPQGDNISDRKERGNCI